MEATDADHDLAPDESKPGAAIHTECGIGVVGAVSWVTTKWSRSGSVGFV